VKSANGTGDEEALLKSDRTLGIPKDWSSDGRFLIYGTIEGKSRRDLWIMAMDGEHKVTKFLQTEANEAGAKFAPEGQASPRYVAYTSDESGKEEVYVTTFPDPNKGKWPISSGGGYQPRWRRDGKELLYFTADGKLMSVDVTLSPIFKAGAPKLLFQAPIFGGGASSDRILWDLTPDGQKFLINTTSNDLSAPIVVVINWQAALKK
jgi:eukaryotic-like serine/threonine-protein kinase